MSESYRESLHGSHPAVVLTACGSRTRDDMHDTPPASPTQHTLLPQPISRFESVKAQKPYSTVTIGNMLKEISDGTHAAKIHAIRGEQDEAKRRTLKADKLEAVLWAGVVNARTGEDIIVSKSGVAMIDFDDVDDPATLKKTLVTTPHIRAAWTSSSGRGVQALVCLPEWCADRESHEVFMKWLIVSSSTVFGHEADKQCSDLVRLSFESNDPDLRINHAAVPYAVDRSTCETRTGRTSPGRKTTQRDRRTPAETDAQREMVKDVIRFYAKQGRPGYDLWLRIIAVTITVMSEEDALAFLKEVLPEEQPGEYQEKLKHPLSRITPQGFLRDAAAAGWKCPPLLGLTDLAKDYIAKVVYCDCKYRVPSMVGYTTVKVSQVRRHLADAGVPPDRIDDILTHIEKTQTVDAVLDLFGRPAGIHMVNGGYRLLVTRGTVLMAAVPGRFATILAFLTEMLGDEQLGYFLGWLKVARRDFAAGSSSPGQILVILGDVKTGKSLLIAIIVAMLGDRRASALAYLTGQTHFNKEVVTVGILVLDDELDGCDAGARPKIKARLKSHHFSREVAVTKKGDDTITLVPIGRTVIAGNATDEVIQVVPRKDTDTADKIMLMKAHRVPGGTLDKLMAAGDPLTALKAELPAFLDFVERYEIPADQSDLRTGVASYWNAELLARLDADDEDAPVIEVIEKHRLKLALAREGHGASDLLDELLKTVGDNARVILGNPTGVSFGKALGRIASKRPDLIRKGKVVHKTARWEILG